MAELKGMVDEVVKNAGSALERDAAIALRRIEQAAQIDSRLRQKAATSAGAKRIAAAVRSRAGPTGGCGSNTRRRAAPASSIIIPYNGFTV